MQMQTFEIKSRWGGLVLYSAEGETLRDVVARAVRDGANLRGADLGGAFLDGEGGNKLTLRGARPILMLGPLGSRSDYLAAYTTDGGVYVRAGCFFGTLDKFRAAITETHGDSNYWREYSAAIAMIEAHAAIWTPEAVAEAA
jgi:hypothetical protein